MLLVELVSGLVLELVLELLVDKLVGSNVLAMPKLQIHLQMYLWVVVASLLDVVVLLVYHSVGSLATEDFLVKENSAPLRLFLDQYLVQQFDRLVELVMSEMDEFLVTPDYRLVMESVALFGVFLGHCLVEET